MAGNASIDAHRWYVMLSNEMEKVTQDEDLQDQFCELGVDSPVFRHNLKEFYPVAGERYRVYRIWHQAKSPIVDAITHVDLSGILHKTIWVLERGIWAVGSVLCPPEYSIGHASSDGIFARD
jgi:hypothetical protein